MKLGAFAAKNNRKPKKSKKANNKIRFSARRGAVASSIPLRIFLNYAPRVRIDVVVVVSA